VKSVETLGTQAITVQRSKRMWTISTTTPTIVIRIKVGINNRGLATLVIIKVIIKIIILIISIHL
jgi:hypothetical protein